MNTLRCVNCGAEYDETAATCASCGRPPPWKAELDGLRGLIKEREVNRGRATVTLIEEAFAALRGGSPVSLSALKGFAFAWLFPRTMIVVGSVVAGLTLILQTIILARQTALVGEQTTLLARQSSAARLDQEERLRTRVGVLQEIVSDLSQLKLATSAAIRLYRLPTECQKPCLDDRALMVIGREAIARKLPSASSFPPAALLAAPSADGATSAVYNAMEAAEKISGAISAALEPQSRLTDSNRQASPVVTLLRSAQRHCLLPAEAASLARDALSVLDAVRSGRSLLRTEQGSTVQRWILAMSLSGVKVANTEPITFLNAGKLTVQDLRIATFNGVDSVDYVGGLAKTLCAKQLSLDESTLAAILAEARPAPAKAKAID